MGAQRDMDLVVHVKPFGMVIQLFSLQGDSGHEAKGPVEIFKVELLEDGISAFHFIPPHSPQVWQQLVPLLSAQPVCLASLLSKPVSSVPSDSSQASAAKTLSHLIPDKSTENQNQAVC